MAKTEYCLELANKRDTYFNQKSPVHREAGFPRLHTETHRQTTEGHCNLETESAKWVKSVKIIYGLQLKKKKII